MDIVRLSNIFNAISVLHPNINYYHCGIHSKVNQSGIPNNFDPLNEVGVQYPFLLFPYPALTASKNASTQKLTTTMTLELNLYDTMFYNNDSTSNTRTEVEIMRDLDTIANDVLAGFKIAAAREVGANGCRWIQVNDGTGFEYIPYAHNNRLACIRMFITVVFATPCSTVVFDFDSLAPTTPVPTEDYDYEDLDHKNDSPL
jgi:hypothetical protein